MYTLSSSTFMAACRNAEAVISCFAKWLEELWSMPERHFGLPQVVPFSSKRIQQNDKVELNGN
jgi:hypothetical protein